MAQDLTARTLSTFHIAHWLQTGPKQLVCLDFNLAAKTREELQTKLLEAIRTTPPDAILRASPKKLWKRFEHAPMKEHFGIQTELLPGGMLAVVIRGR